MAVNQECPGCAADAGCILYWHVECPCRICLVKMICGEACHLYYDFLERIHPSLKIRRP